MGVKLGLAHLEQNRLQVLEKRVLRSESSVARGDWRKLHSEDLHDMHFLPNIIRAIKSGRMRLAGLVARMGEFGTACRVWWGNLKEDLNVDGK